MAAAKYTHQVRSYFRDCTYKDLNQLQKELKKDGYKGASKSSILQAAFSEMIRTKTYEEITELLKLQNII